VYRFSRPGTVATKYLQGGSRHLARALNGSFSKRMLTDGNLANVPRVNAIAQQRGRVSRRWLSWVLRKPAITSA